MYAHVCVLTDHATYVEVRGQPCRPCRERDCVGLWVPRKWDVGSRPGLPHAIASLPGGSWAVGMPWDTAPGVGECSLKSQRQRSGSQAPLGALEELRKKWVPVG